MNLPLTMAMMAIPIGGAGAAARVATSFGAGAITAGLAGATVGPALGRLFESVTEAGDTYNEALRSGMTKEQASEAARNTYTGNMRLYGLDVAEFATAFAGSVAPQLRVLNGLSKISRADRAMIGVARFVTSAGLEGMEEVEQYRIQSESLGQRENAADRRESFILGALTGGVFSTVGAVHEALQRNPQSITDAFTEGNQPFIPPPSSGDGVTVGTMGTSYGRSQQAAPPAAPGAAAVTDLRTAPATDEQRIALREIGRQDLEIDGMSRAEAGAIITRQMDQPTAHTLKNQAEIENSRPQVSEIATPQNASEDDINERMTRWVRRAALEAGGKATLQDIAAEGLTPNQVSGSFWRDTFYQLPREQQRWFWKNVATSLGDSTMPIPTIDNPVVVGTQHGKPIMAVSPAEAAEFAGIGDRVEFLQGEERGYVALLYEANKKISQGMQRETETASITRQVESPSPDRESTVQQLTAEENTTITETNDLRALEQMREAAAQGNLQYHVDAIDKQISTLRNQYAVNDFIDYVSRVLDNSNKTPKIIGKVKDTEAARIKEISGVDVSGLSHEIRPDYIKHMLNEHGDSVKEAKRGQLPVTRDDITRIPEILDSYDKIIPGKKGNNPSVVYVKKFNGTTYYVERIISNPKNKKPRMSGVTMYKKPTPSDGNNAVSGSVHTPKAAAGGATRSIPQVGEKSTGSVSPAAPRSGNKFSSERGAINPDLLVPPPVRRAVEAIRDGVGSVRDHVFEIGKSAYLAGKRTFQPFMQQMRQWLGDQWAKAGKYASAAYSNAHRWYQVYAKQFVFDESGEFTPENKITPEQRFNSLDDEQKARVEQFRALLSKRSSANGKTDQSRAAAGTAQTVPAVGRPFGPEGQPRNQTKREQMDEQYAMIADPAKRKEINRQVQEAQKDTVPVAISMAGRLLNPILTPISSTLRRINTELFSALRKFEYGVVQNIKRRAEAVAPFLDAMRKMDVLDYQAMDLALKNRDVDKIDQLVKKYGIRDKYLAYRAVWNEIFAEAEAAGFDVSFLEQFSPRRIKDYEGLLNALMDTEAFGRITEALGRAMARNPNLTQEEKGEIVNAVIRGYGQNGRLALAEPGALKTRYVDTITLDLNSYYYDTPTAALKYIEDVTEAIEARRFFGKSAQTEGTRVNVGSSVGILVLDLIEKGKINSHQQNEVADALQARFGFIKTDPGVAKLKTINYFMTIGSVISTITQLQDLSYSLYSNGTFRTVTALAKAISKKSEMTAVDLGIEKPWEEMADSGKLGQWLDRLLTATGFNKLDLLGKETLINSTLTKLRAEAQAGRFGAKSQRLLDAVFGEDQRAVINDLAAGRTTDDVKLLMFNHLLDFQPLAKSEMPIRYLNHPQGRIFYQLKTYTIKQLDVFRREGLDLIAEGSRTNDRVKVKQGIANLGHLAFVMMLCGMGTDWIKDWLLGRDQDLSDYVIDNFVRLVGINRYMVNQLRTDGPVMVMAKLALPPFPLLELPARDISSITPAIKADIDVMAGKFDFSRTGESFAEKWDKFRVVNMQSWQTIPYFGKLYYWWFGGGAARTEKKAELESRREETAAKQEARAEVMQGLRAGRAMSTEIAAARAAGYIPRGTSDEELRAEAAMPEAAVKVKHMTVDRAMAYWAEADETTKKQVADVLNKKLENADLTEAERKWYAEMMGSYYQRSALSRFRGARSGAASRFRTTDRRRQQSSRFRSSGD